MRHYLCYMFTGSCFWKALVCDRQTDREGHSIHHASLVSGCENCTSLLVMHYYPTLTIRSHQCTLRLYAEQSKTVSHVTCQLADVWQSSNAVLEVVLLLASQPRTLRETIGSWEQPHKHRLMSLQWHSDDVTVTSRTASRTPNKFYLILLLLLIQYTAGFCHDVLWLHLHLTSASRVSDT